MKNGVSFNVLNNTVLAALGLDADFQLVAVDKEGKEEFWEHNLQRRARATRKMNNGGTDDGRE